MMSSSQQKTFMCRLCNNDISYKTESEFDVHLTVIHFRDRLTRKIQEPFRCLGCGYVPGPSSHAQQVEELLLHYGVEEKFAARFYQEEVSRLPQLASPAQKESSDPKGSITCKLCQSVFDNDRLFVRHISLRHFPKELCNDLPKSEPFICPYIDCGMEQETMHYLILHYGCEHNISRELYLKATSGQPLSSAKVEPEKAISKANNNCSSLFANYLQKTTVKKGLLPTPVPCFPSPVPSFPSPAPYFPTQASPPPQAAASSSSTARIHPITTAAKPKERSTSQLQHFCKFCPGEKRNFGSALSLKHHVLFSHLVPPGFSQAGSFSCPSCSNVYTAKSAFASHFLECHYDKVVRAKSGEKSKPEKSVADAKSKLFLEDAAAAEPLTLKRKPSTGGETRKEKFSSHSHSKSHGDRLKEDRSKSRDDRHSSSKERSHSKSRHDESRSKDNKRTEEKAKRGSESDEAPLPPSRMRQTTHSVSNPRPIVSSANMPQHDSRSAAVSARQKATMSWKKDSIESQRFEIDQLKERIQEMELAHQEALKKKTEDFERWITQREKTLEEEQERRKAVEARFEGLSVVNAETELQLVQHQSREKTLQSELEEQLGLLQKADADRKKLEKQVADLKADVVQIKSLAEERSEELKALQDQLEDKSDAIRELEDSAKEAKSNEERMKVDYEKQIVRLERAVESNAKKVEKLNEEKKVRTAQMKEAATKSSETEAELKKQVAELSKEVGQLNRKLEKNELKRLEQDRSKLAEEFEAQLAAKNEVIARLEVRKDGLLDSLIHIQKLMQGFEALIEDKKETIRDQEGKIADLEALVEDTVDKASKVKELEKEKKELQKQVKQLQVTLQDWETRQFTNVKLISGLEKAKEALEKKVKDFEENNTGAEEELYEMGVKIRNLEKQVQKLDQALKTTDSELTQTRARLQTKTTELAASETKAEGLEQKIFVLEREVRSKENLSDDAAQLKQTVANKEAELSHLRQALSNSKDFSNQLKSSLIATEEQLKALKNSNTKFETDYSLAVSRLETFRQSMKEVRLQMTRQQQQHSNLRDTVRRSIQQLVGVDIGQGELLQQAVTDLLAYVDEDEKTSQAGPIRFRIKAEPVEENGDASVCVSTDRQIVLNLPGTFAIAGGQFKEEPIIPNPEAFSSEDIAADEDLNSSAFEFDSFSNGDARRESLASSTTASSSPPLGPAASSSSSTSASKSNRKSTGRRKRAQLEDVTGQHFPDEDNIVCGICKEYDPPHSGDPTSCK